MREKLYRKVGEWIICVVFVARAEEPSGIRFMLQLCSALCNWAS